MDKWTNGRMDMAPPTADTHTHTITTAEAETQEQQRASASQCHNAVIHNCWKGLDTVYIMVCVRPESCQSNEQPVGGSQKSGGGITATTTTTTNKNDSDERHPPGDLRLNLVAVTVGVRVTGARADS